MKDFDALKEGQAAMHEKIKQHAQELGLTKEKPQKPELKPMRDCVADIQGYLSTSPKIMWLLKEPYDKFTPSGKPTGGGWAFTDWFQDENFWETVDPENKAIYRNISTSSYNIHNNTSKKSCELEEPEIQNTMKRIAFINMSKMPAGKTSPHNHLELCYPKWKDIVFEQIELYKPDIIIFGKTFGYFQESLQISNKRMPTKEKPIVYKKDNMILIDAFHPARKGDDYVKGVVNAVRKAISK